MKDEFIHFEKDDIESAKAKYLELQQKDKVYSVTFSVVMFSSDYETGSYIVNWSEE